EERAVRAGPTEGADAGRVVVAFLAFLRRHAEAVAHQVVAGHDADLAKPIPRHRRNGLGSQDTRAVQLAAIHHHLSEAEVVARSRDQARAPGEIFVVSMRRNRTGVYERP